MGIMGYHPWSEQAPASVIEGSLLHAPGKIAQYGDQKLGSFPALWLSVREIWGARRSSLNWVYIVEIDLFLEMAPAIVGRMFHRVRKLPASPNTQEISKDY